MFHRTSDALAFFVILAVCTAGALKLSWWAAVLGACALVLISLNNNWGRRASIHRARVISDPVQLAASSLNAVTISAASFAFGHLTVWAWGI